MDRARTQTNKILKEMEREIGRIYDSDPALKRIEKKYAKYMKMVDERTKEAYEAYINETDADVKKKLKDAYEDEVRDLTLYSKEYKKLIKVITSTISKVNQKALDIVNDNMIDIYMINYNQVAVDCKKVGIEVNGEE